MATELHPPPEPDEDTIRCCEFLLEQARKGEIRGVAYVALWTGGVASHGWVLDGYAPVYRMVGELHAMSAHILMRHDDDVRSEVNLISTEGL